MINDESKSGRLKLFIDNFLIYGFGGIISKAIPLLMLPIITRIMPNSDYMGVSDLANTIVQFGSSIAIMGMYDAMYRLFFESDERGYQTRICSTALMFTTATSIVVFLLMLVFKNRIASFFFKNKEYAFVVYLSAMATLVGAINSIISAPTRMQNQRVRFLIANTISPLISYGLAIPLLLKGYYIIALPLAAVISSASMDIVFWLLNRHWFDIKSFDVGLLKQLLFLAIPQVPNFLIYWVFGSCDKIMITNILGIGAEGVYSVSSKFGHASQLIYVAFAGGWQYFAFSTMREKDQVITNTRVFEFLGLVSFLTSTFVCSISFILFSILFREEYLGGYIIAPYLFMAPLIQMLFQTGSNQFLIIKKPWPSLIILSFGASANILLNAILIPICGIEGASLATLCGYAVSCIVVVFVLQHLRLMVISWRFIILSLLTIVYFLAWRFLFSDSVLIGIAVWMIFLFASFFLYKKDIMMVLEKVRIIMRAKKQ